MGLATSYLVALLEELTQTPNATRQERLIADKETDFTCTTMESRDNVVMNQITPHFKERLGGPTAVRIIHGGLDFSPALPSKHRRRQLAPVALNDLKVHKVKHFAGLPQQPHLGLLDGA
jgi:hypothetical protein